MSGQEIYENFANAAGPADLAQAAKHVDIIRQQYNHRAEEIRSLSAAMEEGWTGDAAGAATRGAGPLMAEHTQAADAAGLAHDAISAQASAWHDVKAGVQPVPQAPSSMLALVQQVVSGDIERQTEHSNNIAASNVRAMSAWSTVSDDTSRSMPSSYGQIDADAMNISPAPAPATDDTGNTGGSVQGGHVGYSAPPPAHREADGSALLNTAEVRLSPRTLVPLRRNACR